MSWRLFSQGLGLAVFLGGSAAHSQQPTPAPVATPAVTEFQPLPDDTAAPTPPPPIANATIQFHGLHVFAEPLLRAALDEQIQEIAHSGLTRARADDTAFFLEVFYRKHGYTEVLVKWEIAGRTLDLNVQEGPLTHLERIQFIGNQLIPSSTLQPYLTGPTQERFPRASGPLPFIEGDITIGVDRLRGFYSAEGYIDATIAPAVISYSPDHTRADLQVTIHEGIRYTFGAFSFTGDIRFPIPQLLPALGQARHQPFTRLQLVTLNRNLVYFYKSHGYYSAEVTSDTNPALFHSGQVEVVFNVKPGPLFHFDGITATRTDAPDASHRLADDFLDQRFGKLTGRIYDPVAVDDTFRDMMRTGLFRNLRISSTALPDHTVRTDLTYEEAKARELGFSLGYGTFEGALIGISASDRDLFGIGRPLTASLELTQRSTKGELVYVDPWWFNSAYALRTSLYADTRDLPGYSKLEIGIRGDVTRKFTKQIELGVFLQNEKVEITQSVIDPLALGSTSYIIGTIGFTQTFDFRDSALNPGRGWVITSALDADTIDGEPAFGRSTGRLSYYLPLGKSMLAFGARGGLIYPVAGEIPIDERFFNGGSTTVRSFAERELGPKDFEGNPIGGEAFTVFNLEYDFPLVSALYGATFIDAGNLESSFNEAGIEDMRYAIGLGLRYKLPIGPVRVDYGVNPTPRAGEAFGAFHFSFGFAF